MNLTDRLNLLLPDALFASRMSPLPHLIPPMMPSIWGAIPEDEPIDIRCAMAEAETMRRAPLGMSPGELLAGRLDPHTDISALTGEPHGIRPFPGGQTAHTVLDADKLLRLGISGIEKDIRKRMKSANEDQMVFYRSALISLEGFRDMVARLRMLAVDLADTADDPACREEMWQLADILGRVPEYPAQTFHEALQAAHLLYFAAMITVMGLFGTGRLDVVLRPYYEADLQTGRITRERALELICCHFILMNYLFNLPQPVRVGGLDKDGNDVTNDLSYICIEADRLVGLVNPSLALGVNDATPRDLLDKGVESLLSGLTKPALFNDHVIVSGLEKLGVTYEDAVDYIHSTCVEISVVAKSNIYVASPYINLVKILELMLNNGKPMNPEYDPADFYNYTRVNPPGIESYADFDSFLTEYKHQLGAKIEDAAIMIGSQREARYEGWAFPFQSCFTDDCIEKGMDMDRGGARYIWTETSCVGLANLTDSMSVIKQKVFDEKTHTLSQIRDMLLANFDDAAACSDLVQGVPQYGNDVPESDMLAAEIVDAIYSEHAKHKDYLGGPFVPGFFCWIMHRILGEWTWASPDGRRAGDVLADAAGSAQGRDRSGPTAAVRSITTWDHEPGLGGIVLNLRFTADSMRDESSKARLVDLVRAYFGLGGFEMQINAVGTDTLRDAQTHPEKHADLLVRVAGYSDYFTLLDPKMQAEVISRTEHGL
ncbi:MAG: pyruvate formate lyase family protein [Armatimonadota bacterium]